MEELYLVPREYWVESGRRQVLKIRRQNPAMHGAVPLVDKHISVCRLPFCVVCKRHSAVLPTDELCACGVCRAICMV
jgi:hypothetical protein